MSPAAAGGEGPDRAQAGAAAFRGALALRGGGRAAGTPEAGAGGGGKGMLPRSRRSISALRPATASPAPSRPAPAPRDCKPSHPSFPPSGAQLRGSLAKPAQTAPSALQRQATGALRREEEPRAPAVDAAQPGAGCARLVSRSTDAHGEMRGRTAGEGGGSAERPSAAARDNPSEAGEAQGAQGVSPVRGGVLALERKPFTTSGGL